ncbi:MAG: proline--tRNA ligase [Candidatus Aureabacteria bacterium]|nr:proline--tRNA ligase [Candidatus Auribacterota bacterium]
MRWSQTFIPTLKEAPKDAEAVSHQLMLRGGFIQPLSSGLYIYLPLGNKVLDKVSRVIREVLGEYGAIELSMPALQPKSIWERSGRWETMQDIMMKIRDREEKEFILGPTHEEIITDLVARRVFSYRQLPLNFYQIQTKFRDELRPRFGLVRAKEFIMKDGYSFDLSPAGAEISYQKMYEAYFKIFHRCGMPVEAVQADTGAMGDGGKSHEFIVLTPIGEDMVVKCFSCGYSANLELAERKPKGVPEKQEGDKSHELVHTPNARTIEEVSAFFNAQVWKFIKTLIYIADENEKLAVLIRGDYEVNEIKLKRYLKCQQLRMATPGEIEKATGASVGFAGPVQLNRACRLIADLSLSTLSQAITGANKTDHHYQHVNPGRDFEMNEMADIGTAMEGDACVRCGSALNLKRGIEVGHVFFLGEKYTRKLDAKVVMQDGNESHLVMGCYGIGVSRMLSAIVESNHDGQGIIWPVSVSPFEVIITPVDFSDERTRVESLRIYEALKIQNVDILLDDRDERPGFKFKDADLIGIPIKVIIGKKGLDKNIVEILLRKDGTKTEVPLDKAVQTILETKRLCLEKLNG